MKGKRKWLLNGSYTLEAALLMPFLIGILVLVFYIALSFYNRCVMQAGVILGGKQRYYLSGENNQVIKERSAAITQDSVRDYVVGTTDTSCDISVWGRNTLVSAAGQQNAVTLLPGVGAEALWELEAVWEETDSPPEEIYRKVESILFYKTLLEKAGEEDKRE